MLPGLQGAEWWVGRPFPWRKDDREAWRVLIPERSFSSSAMWMCSRMPWSRKCRALKSTTRIQTAMLTSLENLREKLILGQGFPHAWAPASFWVCMGTSGFCGALGGIGQVLVPLGSLQVTVVRREWPSASVGAQSTFQLLGHRERGVRG